MKQYLDLLRKIRNEGTIKPPARENMPSTIGLSHGLIEHDLADGFPLLTTKKMFYKAIIIELLWFLRGDTNIKYLVDNSCNIWNKDAYRWYLKKLNDISPGANTLLSFDSFIKIIKSSKDLKVFEKWFGPKSKYKLGDLGKVYGYQWRNQNGVDQVAQLIYGIKENPFSRYHILDAWNKVDFPEMALPPCHLLYQFTVRETKGKMFLDLNMYQRSCDTFLGVPFNLASMALLLEIIACVTNLQTGRILWIGGDTHVYENHLDQIEEQLSKKPMKLPSLAITKELNTLDDIMNLKYEDFLLQKYNHHPAIKGELSVGL